MNPTSTENDPLMAVVARLDPARGVLPAAVVAHKRELIDQVAGSEQPVAPVVQLATQDAVADPEGNRRRLMVPGAIAAAIVMVAAAFLFTISRTPDAEAALVAAAERTALFDSGRAQVHVELREPVVLQGFMLDYSFEGGNYQLDLIADGTLGLSELGIDGLRYFGSPSGDGDLVWTENTEFPFRGSFVDGVTGANAGPETVLPLIDLADDYQVTSMASGTVYQGTISRADLLAYPELPAGIALVTTGDDPASELPESLVITVTVVDDLIQEVELLVEGDLPTDEYFSATVITTYSEYGQPQNLQVPEVQEVEAPSVAAIPLDAVVPLWAPGPEPQTDAESALAEVLARRPRLCFDAGISLVPQTVDQAFYDDMQADVVACFMNAGEFPAANAIGSMTFGE